jgi:hypothetical protein
MEKEPHGSPPPPTKPDTGLIIFDNPDKLRGRKSGPEPYMPDWPFRLLCAGPPGCGKRSLLLNLITKLSPPPSAVHIVHYDVNTAEYEVVEMLGCPVYTYGAEDFPTMDNIENPDPVPIGDSEVRDSSDEDDPGPVDVAGAAAESPLVIVDELTKDTLVGESLLRFERLMNYVSTHKNCSVICSIQAITSLPPACRRGFNQFVLWPQADLAATAMAATRCGVPPEMIQEMFRELCTKKHDSVWIDCAAEPDSPWRFRLNFKSPIRAAATVMTARDFPS